MIEFRALGFGSMTQIIVTIPRLTVALIFGYFQLQQSSLICKLNYRC